MQFARENVPYSLDDSEMKSNRSSNPFSEFSSFHVGNKDLKRRTGSWRVFRILATINLAYWIGFFVLIYPNKVAVLNWLGLSSWDFLSIVFLVQLAFSVVGLAYLHFYPLPPKKSSTQP